MYFFYLCIVANLVTQALANCGGTLTDASGNITSPNYPSPYDASLNCKWTIQNPKENLIRINVTDLNLHTRSEKTCLEFLSLFEIGSVAPLVYCGDEAVPVFESNKTEIEIDFQTDAKDHGNLRGFSLFYTTVLPTTTPAPTTSTAPLTTTVNTTETPTTVPVTATIPPKKGKGMKGWAIALIIIFVILVALLIIDMFLYTKNKGCIYSIRTKCCGGYDAV